MALTVGGLVAIESLRLRVLAGHGALDRPIGWVHSTELADPTAFLDGGELLLTTGLAPARDADGYVRRLVGAGVAGIGFGSGINHDEVPAALVEAAEAAGLPLFDVPRRTPFIAITKAVSAAVAADEYAALIRTGRAQRRLTRAAVGRSGPSATVRALAGEVDGWVLLLDTEGRPVHASPAASRDRSRSLEPLLARLRSGTRLGSVVDTVGEDEVFVQALATRSRSFLAVGRPATLEPADRTIVNTAASLLALALEGDQASGRAVRRLRGAILDLLLAGRTEAALAAWRELPGAVPAQPWTVVALLGPPRLRAAVVDAVDTFEGARLAGERDGAALLLMPATVPPQGMDGMHAGVSEPVPPGRLAEAWDQARQAAAAARAAGEPLLRFADHAGVGLLSLLPADAAEGFANGLLAPLRAHDLTGRGDLVESLRCWLSEHGHWDAAAERLGVHRHTLRNRMRKIEELTGRSLNAPGVRAELWLALNLPRPSKWEQGRFTSEEG
ncbi:PucR family transcriptional regulator [Amycolatopsis suaedae]|uniref:PucR family transcriptional regulator n=1 Tax=Amycolatopsis suaedae TaxID=2510978 RepID=A0A4Q7J4S6_9PSEU|nr:PucR family transcriptional regulator ligand-binding domain-containing protein [Amycolatopsis suaedae]RZQ62571.1 PucR family transcriptional regulator [Amycolatopsis suaedae]